MDGALELPTRRKNNSEIAQQMNQFLHDVDFDHTTRILITTKDFLKARHDIQEI